MTLLIHTHLIEGEVLQQRRPRWVAVEDTEHLLASLREQLLGVAGVRHWLTLLRVAGREVRYTAKRR